MKNNKKIFIAGCGGMLGEAIYDVFHSSYEILATDIDLNEKWLKYLDFRNYSDYFKYVKEFLPNALFHIGAHTDLEYCEKNPDDAYLTNTISVEYAVRIANYFNIPLIFISTAGIFDGKKETYDDWDTPNPLGVYARSKYLAENYIENNCNDYLICRAGWMMGGGIKKDKKFIKKIFQQIFDKQEVINIVNDKFGTPTYTYDFASNLKLIFENDIRGLFNLVCKGMTSRLEVAQEVLSVFNLTNKISLNEVDSSFFKKTYFAPRPYSERLVNYKLNLLNMDIMRDWKLCLREYLKASFKIEK